MIFFKEKKTRWVKKVISMGLDCEIKRNHTAILGAEKRGPHRSRDGTAQGRTVTALPPSCPSVLGTGSSGPRRNQAAQHAVGS